MWKGEERGGARRDGVALRQRLGELPLGVQLLGAQLLAQDVHGRRGFLVFASHTSKSGLN